MTRTREARDVCAVEDVPDGSHVVVDVDGRELGIFHVGGRFYALPNVCSHQNGPLCRGRLGGKLAASAESDWRFHWEQGGAVIQCPWHGLEFDVPTGRCLNFPRRRLPVYDVRVVDGRVLVHV